MSFVTTLGNFLLGSGVNAGVVLGFGVGFGGEAEGFGEFEGFGVGDAV